MQFQICQELRTFKYFSIGIYAINFVFFQTCNSEYFQNIFQVSIKNYQTWCGFFVFVDSGSAKQNCNPSKEERRKKKEELSNQTFQINISFFLHLVYVPY